MAKELMIEKPKVGIVTIWVPETIANRFEKDSKIYGRLRQDDFMAELRENAWKNYPQLWVLLRQQYDRRDKNYLWGIILGAEVITMWKELPKTEITTFTLKFMESESKRFYLPGNQDREKFYDGVLIATRMISTPFLF
ncbi:MAG: hypothetical protein V1808_00625 [Candidatus Daviesbacteria bacterium]